MKITSIEIVEFGRLKDKKLTFDDALTLIIGENESGKSTLLLFIKFILYGIAKRQKNAPVAEADRALSWDTDSAEGSLILTHEGKSYKITRRLRKTAKSASDKLQVVCLDDGTVREDIACPGEYFLGIGADAYESTSSISQLGAGSIKGESVAAAAQNLASNADETINTEKTLKAIEALRVKYLHKVGHGGTIYETEARLDYLRGEYRRAVDANVDTEKIKEQLESIDKRIGEISAKQRTADELVSKINVLTVVKLFDRLHEYEAARDGYERDVAEKKAGLTKDGFLVDRKYLSELKGLMLNVSTEKEGIAELNKRYDAEAEAMGTDAPASLKKIEDMGGPDTLAKNIASKKKSSRILLISALAIAIEFGISSILYPAMTPGLVVAAGLVAAAVLAAFGIARLISIKKICASLALDQTEYEDQLEACQESLASRDKSKARLDALRETLQLRRDLYNSAMTRLEEHIDRYADNSADAYETAIKLSEQLSRQLDELDNAQNLLTLESTKISELSRELEPYNEHKMRGRISPEVLEMSDEEADTAKREKHYYDAQLRALTEKKNILERSLVEKSYLAKDPFVIAEEIQALETKAKTKREEYDAILLASKAITEASANMRGTLTPKLRALANEYMSALTSGKYGTVGLSDKLDITMSSGGFMHHLDAYSTGTKDAAYISLRLALLNVLSNGALPPVFMDETLAMIDDKRAHKVLEVLSRYCENGGQCFLFSCHDREERLCDYHEIKHTVIKL